MLFRFGNHCLREKTHARVPGKPIDFLLEHRTLLSRAHKKTDRQPTDRSVYALLKTANERPRCSHPSGGVLIDLLLGQHSQLFIGRFFFFQGIVQD